MLGIDDLAKLNDRISFEAFVAANPQPCPNCGEEKQIQLRNAFDEGGALWKCRKCRHRWHYTPNGGLL